MKFLPIQEFDIVNSALNFDTVDCHVLGGCDLYTTKAAGSDKKLYKTIEHSLESQHASLVRLSASLSPPQTQPSVSGGAGHAAASINLSRSSPFGPLSQISSRRTFAYLIATLNASHPDYDFSHILRPADFRRERSLKAVVAALNTTLYNLRPQSAGGWRRGASGAATSTGEESASAAEGSSAWGPKMWSLIDKEMGLRDCTIYGYEPDQDPFDGEEGAVWSVNYFFFNKAKKRVCYLYLRGLSIASHSPRESSILMSPRVESKHSRTLGARKRARYWLGDRTVLNSGWDEEDDDEQASSITWSDTDELYERIDEDDTEDEPTSGGRQTGHIRAISEEVAASMEV